MRLMIMLLITVLTMNASASLLKGMLEAITEFKWFKEKPPHHIPDPHPSPDTHPFPDLLPTPTQDNTPKNIFFLPESDILFSISHSLRDSVNENTLRHHQVNSILVLELPAIMEYSVRARGISEHHSRRQYLNKAKQALQRITAEAKGKYETDRELLMKLLQEVVPDLDAYRDRLIKEKKKIFMKITGFDQSFHVRVLVKDVHPANAKFCYWQEMKQLIRQSLTTTKYPQQLENEVYGWVTEEKMRVALENAAKQIGSGARAYFAESLGKGYGLVNDFYSRVEVKEDRVKITVDAPCGKEGQFIFKNETAPVLEDEKGAIVMTPYINILLLQ